MLSHFGEVKVVLFFDIGSRQESRRMIARELLDLGERVYGG